MGLFIGILWILCGATAIYLLIRAAIYNYTHWTITNICIILFFSIIALVLGPIGFLILGMNGLLSKEDFPF